MVKSMKPKEFLPKNPQSYVEYKKPGHIKAECPLFKKKEKKDK